MSATASPTPKSQKKRKARRRSSLAPTGERTDTGWIPYSIQEAKELLTTPVFNTCRECGLIKPTRNSQVWAVISEADLIHASNEFFAAGGAEGLRAKYLAKED